MQTLEEDGLGLGIRLLTKVTSKVAKVRIVLVVRPIFLHARPLKLQSLPL